MLRACSYCGGIHDGECPHKPKRNYKQEHANASDSRIKERKFRSSTEWKDCRANILDRDKHLCRICLYEDGYISVGQPLDVHHIEPLHKAWSKRTRESNLITVCKAHHYQCDHGQYKAQYLKKIISTPPTLEKKNCKKS